MFVGITNTPRPYPWGSSTAIADLLGRPHSGAPEAELWLGAHPGSPSEILDPAIVGGARNLAEWIADAAAGALGPGAGAGAGSAGGAGDAAPRLPFLMKVLAAASPLSLQAHPTAEQAREGFERENLAGVPADAPSRNYKDAFPKPELMLALSDTFEALCGFRPAAAVRETLTELVRADLGSDGQIDGLLKRLPDDAALAPAFEWLISRGDGVDELVASVVTAAAASDSVTRPIEFATILSLAEQYPGDPGIVISLLVNRVSLKRGEVLYLPAGNIHAYLFGLCIEVMAASDNVLRGGLTPKHVDVPELLSVLDFSPLPVPYLKPTVIAPGVSVYRPDVPDFVLVHAEGSGLEATYQLGGPAIALCLSGSFSLCGATSEVSLGRGESVYVTPDERTLTIAGTGELVLATPGE